MALDQKEYNLLLDIFCGDEDIISFISTKDINSFSSYLLKKLDGSIKGVKNLEDETNKIINLVKDSELSQKNKDYLQQVIINTYSNIAINIVKK